MKPAEVDKSKNDTHETKCVRKQTSKVPEHSTNYGVVQSSHVTLHSTATLLGTHVQLLVLMYTANQAIMGQQFKAFRHVDPVET